MENQTSFTPSDIDQLAIIQKKLSLDNKIRSGLNWFFWIAGLSLLNTILYSFGTSITFVIGLGVTQIVDGFMDALANEFNTGGGIIRLIGFAIDLFIAGIFVAIGILGRRRYRAPVIIGMAIYTVDGIILLLFQNFLGAGFHALALAGVWNGLKSISELERLEKIGAGESIESIRQRIPQVTPQQRRTRLILIGLILLVPIILCVILSFQN